MHLRNIKKYGKKSWKFIVRNKVEVTIIFIAIATLLQVFNLFHHFHEDIIHTNTNVIILDAYSTKNVTRYPGKVSSVLRLKNNGQNTTVIETELKFYNADYREVPILSDDLSLKSIILESGAEAVVIGTSDQYHEHIYACLNARYTLSSVVDTSKIIFSRKSSIEAPDLFISFQPASEATTHRLSDMNQC